MRIPWIMYAAAASQALPLLATAVRRPDLGLARAWVVRWCGFLVAANVLALVLALAGQNNHWLNYLVTPISAGMALWTLALWQWSSVGVLSLRVMIPLLAVAWVLIVVLFEDTKTFSLLAEPFAALLVLGAAIYTLISRVFHETGNLLRQDWLWVAAGMALYASIAIALPPTANWLLARHPELVSRAYQAKALLEIVSFLAITRGMLLPRSTLRSKVIMTRRSAPAQG